MRIQTSRWVYREDLSSDPVPSDLIKKGGGIHAKVVRVETITSFRDRHFYPNAATVSMPFLINRIASSQKGDRRHISLPEGEQTKREDGTVRNDE